MSRAAQMVAGIDAPALAPQRLAVEDVRTPDLGQPRATERSMGATYAASAICPRSSARGRADCPSWRCDVRSTGHRHQGLDGCERRTA
jgi:hypothetical protein